MKRSFIFSLIGLVLLFASCPNPLLKDSIKKEIQDEVDYATADELKLTISAPENGTTSPTGTSTIKSGIAQPISVTPFQTHAFLRWEKESGSGTVAFENADSSSTTVTVTGGDAAIRPVLEPKPKVLFTTPIGNNIARNTQITVTLSKELDSDSVNEKTVKLLKNGETEVAGEVSYDSRRITFNADSTLESYTGYIITLNRSVSDTLGISLASDYISNMFQTGKDLDNTGPTAGAFEINGTEDYSSDLDVTLTDISAIDAEGPVAWIYIANETTGDGTPDDETFSDPFPYDTKLPWTLSELVGGSGADGTRSVYLKFADPALNESAIVSRSIELDTTGPESGSVSIGSPLISGFTNNSTVTLTIDASDSGVNSTDSMAGGQMLIASDSRLRYGRWDEVNGGYQYAVWEEFAGTVSDWTIEPADGTKAVYVRFRDALGNASDIYTVSFQYDNSAPEGTVQINGGALYTNNSSVALTLTVADGGIGTDAAEMEISGDINEAVTQEPFDSTPVRTLSGGDGNKTISVAYSDKLGNTATPVVATILYDTTAPTAQTIVLSDPSTGNTTTSGTAQVEVSLSATDSTGSGIQEMWLSNDSGFTDGGWASYATTTVWNLPGGNGSKEVFVKFRDRAGNVSSWISDTIDLDTTAPEGGFNINEDAVYTVSANVQIHSNITNADVMQFSNNGSTWSTELAYASTANWVLNTGDGTKTVYARYRNNANGIWSSIQTDTIILDTTPPVVTTAQINGSSINNEYINSTSVNLSMSVTGANAMRFSNDNTTWSGWQSYAPSSGWTLSSGSDGSRTVYFQFRDPAGNMSSVSDSVTLDRVAPAVTSAYAEATPLGVTDVTITSTISIKSSVTDSSPLEMRLGNYGETWGAWETYTETRAGWTVGSPTFDGTKRIYYQFRDAAGNYTSSVNYDEITLDTTPPTLNTFTIDDGRTYAYQRDVTLNISASNDPAQMRFYYVVGSTYQWTSWEPYTSSKSITLRDYDGYNYVYVQLQDSYGNTTSSTYDYIVLDRPWISYATIGRPAGKSQVRLYFSEVASDVGEMSYRVYAKTDPAGAYLAQSWVVYNSGDAITVPAEEQTYYFYIRTRHLRDSYYYYSNTYYTDQAGNDKPGIAADVVVVYDGDETALAEQIRTILKTDYGAQSWTTGTQPDWSVITIPEDNIPNAYAAQEVIYGKPTILTPGVTFSWSSSTYDGRARNIAASGQGIIGMGVGGTSFISRAGTNYSAWGLSGTAPADIGYGHTASFTTPSVFAKVWTSGNNLWTYPLTSTSIPTTNEATVQLAYTGMTRQSVYRGTRTAPSGGYLLAEDVDNTLYFPLVQQGRFLHWGFNTFPDRAYTGYILLINSVYRMSGW